MSFRHDGVVRLELLRDSYEAFDVTVTHIDDQERIRGVLRYWIAAAAMPTRRRTEFPGWRHLGTDPAYATTISATTSPDAPKFGYRSATARDGFRDMLAHGRADPSSPAAQGFIDAVTLGARHLFRYEQQRAEVRVAGGKYLEILEDYLAEMRAYVDVEDQNFAYDRVRSGIGAVLDDERYLTLSSDPRIRALYADLLAEQSSLYNWYMDVAKGGHVRARRPS